LCAEISPVVNPRAVNDNTISSTPVSRRCRNFGDLRLERGISVTWDLDLHRPDLSQHRLRPNPDAGVAAVPTERVVLLVAQMGRHLLLQRSLQHPFGELVQQPIRPNQLHSVELLQLPADRFAGPRRTRQRGRSVPLPRTPSGPGGC
jgi:hypothetical protein